MVGILNSALSLYYYAGVIRAMYAQAPADVSPVRESGIARVLLGVTVAGTLILGIYPEPFVRLVQAATLLARQ